MFKYRIRFVKTTLFGPRFSIEIQNSFLGIKYWTGIALHEAEDQAKQHIERLKSSDKFTTKYKFGQVLYETE